MNHTEKAFREGSEFTAWGPLWVSLFFHLDRKLKVAKIPENVFQTSIIIFTTSPISTGQNLFAPFLDMPKIMCPLRGTTNFVPLVYADPLPQK